MTTTSKDKLNNLLSKVGDLNFQRRIKRIFEYLDIQPNDKVLDCGCGDGFYTLLISKLYDCKITSSDFSRELLDQAAQNLGDGNKKKVTFVQADFTKKFPFENSTFDKIIFTEVIEHLDDDKFALEEVKRILKKNGKVALTVPHKNYPLFWDPLNWIREHLGLGHFDAKNFLLGGVWSYDHKRLYTEKMLKNLCEDVRLKTEASEGLTHYTLPFNLNLLYIGKQLYISLPLPKSVTLNMEKFNVGGRSEKNMFVELPFKLAKWVDSYNEKKNFLDENKSFITLFCGLKKV